MLVLSRLFHDMVLLLQGEKAQLNGEKLQLIVSWKVLDSRLTPSNLGP